MTPRRTSIKSRQGQILDVAFKFLALLFTAMAIVSGLVGEYARGAYDLLIAHLMIWLAEH